MAKNRAQSDYGIQIRRKQTIHTAVMVALVCVLVASATVVFIGWRSRLGNEKKELIQLWEDGAYDLVFNLSRERLLSKPMDYSLLILHGFASYQLAVAQINRFDTLTYIDECIWSLRKALLSKEGPGDLRIYYVLGKAYYNKGQGYADLAVQFLEEARDGAYNAGDIPEYLGLAYADIHDYRSSVAAFSLALNPQEGAEVSSPGQIPSDRFLLAIAHSYIELNEPDAALAYLVRCVETSRDSNAVTAARLLLGAILGKAGDTEGAEAQYLAILEDDGDNAEAYYQLGELYAAGGDTTRARAEWRRAVRVDPAHAGARVRLNM
jgi:tetratricopeptide (TPR) repeat protein